MLYDLLEMLQKAGMNKSEALQFISELRLSRSEFDEFLADEASSSNLCPECFNDLIISSTWYEDDGYFVTNATVMCSCCGWSPEN